jgi:hypothetical protein
MIPLPLLRSSSLRLVSLVVATSLLLFSGNIVTVTAYPWGAGHCSTGNLSNKSGGEHGNVGNGSLDNGNLVMKLDSTDIDAGASSTTITAGKTYSLTLSRKDGTNAQFKGFLFRLSDSSGGDVSGSFTITDSSRSKIHTTGCGAKISAATHPSSSNKSSVSVNFKVEGVHSNLFLEVTVVKENDGGSNAWHYTSYNLASEAEPEAPSRSPSSSEAPSLSPSPTEPICNESPTDQFTFNLKKDEAGNIIGSVKKTCQWLKKRPSTKLVYNICKKNISYGNVGSPADVCCDTCECEDGTANYFFKYRIKNGNIVGAVEKKCTTLYNMKAWPKQKLCTSTDSYNWLKPASQVCPRACGVCKSNQIKNVFN